MANINIRYIFTSLNNKTIIKMENDFKKLVNIAKEDLKILTFFDGDYNSLVVLHSEDIELYESEIDETLGRELKCNEGGEITTNNFIGISNGNVYLAPEDTSEPPFYTSLDNVTDECIISLHFSLFPSMKEVKLGKFNKSNPFVFIDSKGGVWSKIMDKPHLLIIEHHNKIKLFDTENQTMVGDYLNAEESLKLFKEQAELYYKVCEL